MKPKRADVDIRAMLTAGQMPLWPNIDGLLITGASPSRGHSNALRLLRLPPSPQVERRRALYSLRSRSLSSWLHSKNPDVTGFGIVREAHFSAWLKALLRESDYGAMELDQVLHLANLQLGFELDDVKRYLAKRTAAGSEFRSDGDIVTLSDGYRHPSHKKASAP